MPRAPREFDYRRWQTKRELGGCLIGSGGLLVAFIVLTMGMAGQLIVLAIPLLVGGGLVVRSAAKERGREDDRPEP